MPAMFEKPDLFNQQDDLVDAIYRKETAAKFKVGDYVVDRGGYAGRIVSVTFYQNSIWYDVRMSGGVGIRFESDLFPG